MTFTEKENKAIKKAYHYIYNVSVKQGRFLSQDDMYAGYKSLINEFTEKTFKLVYEGFREAIQENKLKHLEGRKTLREIFGL